MSDLFLLTPSQFGRIRPKCPLAHGIERVDDLRVVKRTETGQAMARRADRGWLLLDLAKFS